MNNYYIKKFIYRRFHINDSIPEEIDLFKDIYQEIELFILEKEYDENYFFSAIVDNSELYKEFNEFISDRYKIMKGINNPDDKVDFELEMEKDKNAIFLDDDSILRNPKSAVFFNKAENELKGVEVLENILPPFELEAFVYKVIKPAEYDYLFITGISSSGIDKFFRQAVERIKIFQKKEAEQRKMKK